MARRLMPAATLAPLVIGEILILGEKRLLYDTHLKTALFSVAEVVTWILLIWLAARNLNLVESARNEEKASEAGATRLLLKPTSVKQIGEIIQEVLSENRQPLSIR